MENLLSIIIVILVYDLFDRLYLFVSH